jgi:hypothetical protein
MPSELNVSLANKGIQTLVREIEQGKIVLPEFQRDFVWPTGQVAKLMESILNGYYINTLLTLPVMAGGDNVPFPPRAVEASEEPPRERGGMEMVLDGQQRITSIHYALKAPDNPLANTKHPQRFGLKFSKVVDGTLDESAVDWKTTYYEMWAELENDDYETQIEKDFVPFTVFQSSDVYEDWRFGMEDYAATVDSLTREDVRNFDRNTKVFRSYDIPIIEFSSDTEPTTVVQTFERINTQGLELGVFDILTARLHPNNIRLRKLWESTVEEKSNIRSYADSAGRGTARNRMLKTLALFRDNECKEAALRELDSTNFESDWALAAEMLDRALDKAQSAAEGGLGVTQKYGFPYGTMLPTLSNLIHIAERDGSYPDHEGLKMVRRWYWASVFSLRYSGSSDTVSYNDYREVRDWIRDERAELPEAIGRAGNRIPVELDLASLTRGGPYNGIMSLLVLRGARDFGTFESITVHDVDDHHIFPNAVLKSGLYGTKYEATQRNRILNRTVIESRGNRFRYSDSPPSEYVRQMIEEHPDSETGVKRVLDEHFINESGFEAMLADDYERFCRARRSMIREEISERVGVDVDWSLADETSL